MEVKTELHIHTRYSKDSLLPCFMLLVMCKIKNINNIAVCDHNSINIKKNKKKFKKAGINIIIGEEIFTADGEIIGLFLNNEIPAGLSVNETVRNIKNQGGLVYVPHPYDLKRQKTVLEENAFKEIVQDIDIIEIHNGRNICDDYSIQQKKIADKYCDKAAVAQVCGSDAHTFFEIGRNYIISESYNVNNPCEFKKAMISGKLKNSKCHPCAHTVTKFAKIIKLLLKGNLNEAVGIVLKRCRKGNKKTG